MPVVNLKSSNSRNPLKEGEWEAVVKEVKSGETKVKGTPYVEFVYQVTDEDAVDTEGNRYKGRVWDKYFVTETATWRLKKLVSALGGELPDDDAEVDLADLAEDLAEQFVGNDVKVKTSLREHDEKQYVDVDEVTA